MSFGPGYVWERWQTYREAERDKWRHIAIAHAVGKIANLPAVPNKDRSLTVGNITFDTSVVDIMTIEGLAHVAAAAHVDDAYHSEGLEPEHTRMSVESRRPDYYEF